jgi:hypothetical protein
MLYRILPTKSGQYPLTGDISCIQTAADHQHMIGNLKAFALRLTCMASLLEIYDMPGGLEEAVETLESIAKFYDKTDTQSK